MSAKHDYTLKRTVGYSHVEISPSTNYGWFENESNGGGGGLWFDDKTLQDYDGVASLPKNVVTAIRQLGYIVPEDME